MTPRGASPRSALRRLHDADLAEAGRALIGLLLDLAHDAGAADPVAALRLVEQHVALAQGFVTMKSQAFGATGRLFDDEPGARVVRASAALVRGAR